jgi:hypothetical protein
MILVLFFTQNWKLKQKHLEKTGFLYMIWPWRVVLTYTIVFYTYQSTFLSKKINVKEKLTGRPSPTVQCCILIPGNVRVKPHFSTQWGSPAVRQAGRQTAAVMTRVLDQFLPARLVNWRHHPSLIHTFPFFFTAAWRLIQLCLSVFNCPAEIIPNWKKKIPN